MPEEQKKKAQNEMREIEDTGHMAVTLDLECVRNSVENCKAKKKPFSLACNS